MAGKIPQSFIDDLLNRVDIVDIIDHDLPLKKTGKDFQALCPFHGEKTPSFTVSQEKQFYHCFGCGAHGSALGFLMNHRGLGFVEAVEEAARSVGLEVPYEDGPRTPQVDYTPLYNMLDAAQTIFAQQLRSHPDRERAVAYLKGRGLSGQIAKRFGIGFAPDAWRTLLDKLGTDDAAVNSLLGAGLAVEKDEKRYDRFRDRITFPIYDRRGRVVAFGGRVIDKGEPKYLNSPETPVFQKRRELYGLYQARQANTKMERILVVEGYMDVVALAQFGVNNAVATLGTATTAEQIETLFKTAPEICFCYDGDNAGRRAAWRALETTLPLIREGRQAGFMFMPEGHDPDSYVREFGNEVFSDRDRITPLSSFLLDEMSKKADMDTIDGRARFAELTKPMLKKIAPGSFRQLLTQKVAEMAELDIRSFGGGGTARANPPRSTSGRKSRSAVSMVDRAIKRLLFDPALAASVTDFSSLATLNEPNIDLLTALLEICVADPNITTGTLVEKFRDGDFEPIIARHLAAPLELDPDAEATEFKLSIEGLVRKSRQVSVLDAAREELQRRTSNPEQE